ncbi:MAG TPA: N-dimethylarginine dimethylaminohydrolase [Mycobacterium sp.]|nr:N-dimethylarginine dimethylaminohydrolase [Mycobacterium sp.]
MTRPPPQRLARVRHYIMAPPTYFAVDYQINPWMDPAAPVDAGAAMAQWQQLRDLYHRLGHRVTVVEPVAGLPDMVYAANAGLIVGRTAIVARFRHHQRDPESAAYAAWLSAHGYQTVDTRHINEGQGDLLLVDGMILAGSGFRTDVRAHTEIADITGLPVISLELADARFYHLDTALAVLDDTTIAYYPPAFAGRARAQLRELFPDAILVDNTDADVLGLNVVSDGRHVVHPSAAVGFAEQLREAGFVPIGVQMSELLKGGGSVKCCTLEAYS